MTSTPFGDPDRRPAHDIRAGGGEEVLAGYDRYGDAQRAVHYLSDNHFPVEEPRIVGCDLELVEDITGRLTRGRAAAAGAMSGAWIGLLSRLCGAGITALALVAADRQR